MDGPLYPSNYEFKNWCYKPSKGASAKFQGGCYSEDIPREAGARRGALWSPAYADPSSYHSPAVLREDNLFGVLISLSLNNVFSGSFEVSAVVKDYNDLIQTASSSSSLRRQT